MKKKLALIILLALCLGVCFSFAGCGGNEDTDSQTETETETESETDTSNDTSADTETDTETEVESNTDTDEPGHVHTEEIIPAIAPTCTKTGLTEGKKCSECGEVLIEQEIVDAKGHKYEGSFTCTVCGDTLVTSEGLEYTLDEETNTYTVTDIGTCTDTDIVIPYTYNGLSVTSIGNYAFSNCTSLTSVTIGNSVTSIGNHAFEDCTSLTEINFNAIAMNDLSVGNSVFSNAGENGEGIKVTMGKKVTKIPACLFWPDYSPKITSVVFEEGSVCESIGDLAFSGCTSLTSVTIPDSVTSIGRYAFSDCTSLTSITIPDSVTSIGDGAFYDCTSLTSVTIGNSVTSIGDYAFSVCTKLASVTIGDSVTSIGDYAFINCTSLTIYCEATSQPSGWQLSWNYSNRPVYWYSEEEPTTDGNYWHYVDGAVTIWE